MAKGGPRRRGLPAAPRPAPRRSCPESCPERRLRRGLPGVRPGRRELCGRRAGQRGRRGPAGPRRPPPGSRGSLCLGGPSAPPGSLEREKDGRAGARWAAEPSGPGGAGAAAELTVLTGLTGGALPVPRGAATAAASASGSGAVWGRSRPLRTRGPASGTWPRGVRLRGAWRVLPGPSCPGPASVSGSVLRAGPAPGPGLQDAACKPKPEDCCGPAARLRVKRVRRAPRSLCTRRDCGERTSVPRRAEPAAPPRGSVMWTCSKCCLRAGKLLSQVQDFPGKWFDVASKGSLQFAVRIKDAL